MAVKKVTVRTHQRRSKSGKISNVMEHKAARDVLKELLDGSPSMQAAKGQFTDGKSLFKAQKADLGVGAGAPSVAKVAAKVAAKTAPAKPSRRDLRSLTVEQLAKIKEWRERDYEIQRKLGIFKGPTPETLNVNGVEMSLPTPVDIAAASLQKQLTGTAPPPSLEEQAIVSAFRVAEFQYGFESKHTPFLQGLVADLPSLDLAGIEFSRKPFDSLVKKVHRKALGSTHRDTDKSSDGLSDIVRYTVVSSDPKSAVAEWSQIVQALKVAGHSRIEFDNSWQTGNAYQGINTVFRSPEGIGWELQFHTPDSFRIKDANHKDYEIMRAPETPHDEKWAAYARMLVSWEGVEKPTGWETFGDQRLYGTPTGKVYTQFSQAPTAGEAALAGALPEWLRPHLGEAAQVASAGDEFLLRTHDGTSIRIPSAATSWDDRIEMLESQDWLAERRAAAEARLQVIVHWMDKL